jgi:uridine kinase
MVLIGGNARTGKSTLASYLRIAFEKTGHRVLTIGLDNWLLPESRRTESMNVFDRFQLKILEKDIKNLRSGQTLVLSSYSNHPERKPLPLEYTAGDSDIIIVEGVVALSSEIVRRSAQLKLFTTVNSEQFRKRIEEYYSWRNKTKEEIELLVNKRELDEYQLIEKESKLADLIINSSVS